MKDNKLSVLDLQKLLYKWWETPLVYDWRKKEYHWDEEVKAVNSMMDKIDGFPEWALHVRDAMPKYGFEMCSHRWLDGLGDVIKMIRTEKFNPSTAGWCGDVHGTIFHAAEKRATAVQSWIEGRVSPNNGLHTQVADWLGKPTPEKEEAARCYVEPVRAYFFPSGSDDHAKTLSEHWRTCADKNEVLKIIFEGEGLDRLLRHQCLFNIIDRLDLYIRIIGGDHSQLTDRHHLCTGQLRFVMLYDPIRFDTTLGYLWGWQAYLLGQDGEWLRAAIPECAGAAIYALRGVSRAGKPTPLLRWLAASLLKSTKIWCQLALKLTPDDSIPAYARVLPNVIDAIREY